MLLRKFTLLALVALMAILCAAGAGYYYFTVYRPAHIDFTDGTEFVFALDFQSLDGIIQSVENAYKIASAEKPNSPKAKTLALQLDTLQRAKSTARDRLLSVVKLRIDPNQRLGYRTDLIGETRSQLRVQVPPIADVERSRILSAIKTQGHLTFHICTENQEIIDRVSRVPQDVDGNRIYVDTDGLEYIQKSIRTPKRIVPDEFDVETIVVSRYPGLDGSRISKAYATPNQYNGGWQIDVQLTREGTAEFAQLTRENIRKRMAIVLDGEAKSAPTIQSEIVGVCQITGRFTKEEAERLAAILNSGSLPIPLKLQTTQPIGTSNQK